MAHGDTSCQEVAHLAARMALQDRSWMKYPARLTGVAEEEIVGRLRMVSIPVDETLEGTELFVFTDPTEKPGASSVVIAVTRGREAFRIRALDDFQRLLFDNGLEVTSAQEALQLAKQYTLVLGTGYPQYWAQVRVLESAGDIPLREGETLPAEICGVIQPPEVQQHAYGFTVRLFTWNELGGELRSYEFHLSPRAELRIIESLVGSDVGRAWLPK